MKKFYLVLAILVQVSVVFSQGGHFKKGFVGSGYNQMSINIVGADIGTIQLDAGDEVAVFDGNLCCGVVELTQTIVPGNVSTYATISASADDGEGNGFTSGNKMYFRFWDSSAGTEYHNVVPVVTDNGGSPITNAFAADGTAFVNASTANTTKTFNGAVIGLWDFDSNWTPVGVPEPNNDVVVPPTAANSPNIWPTAKAYCGSLDIQGAHTLTIQSDATGTGSLVVGNIISASSVYVWRYMSGNAWHLISSPISGQSITNFLTTNPANIPTNGASRGMMDYVESANDWSAFYTNATAGNISLGNGYGIRTGVDAGVLFTGTMTIDDINVSVSKSDKGWNLIGNPYPSAILATQEALGFLVENESVLEDSYVAIYTWDEGAGEYSVINSGSGNVKLAAGQGFFVKTSAGGNVAFKQSMQVHDTGLALKSAEITSSKVVLKAKSGDITASAKINFDEEMTLGLDRSYDAGILRNGKGFDIYTRLVEDNGVDFAIQWLPGNASDSYEIPVGVDATKGGEIVFSAETIDLPTGYSVVMEDRLTNSQADISNGELYVADLGAESNGVGRFYLKVGSSLQTGIDDIQKNDLSVYKIDSDLYIKGNVSNKAEFMVYSIDGRLMNRFGATSESLNRLNIAGYTPGVYFVRVQDVNKYKPVKFVVER